MEGVCQKNIKTFMYNSLMLKNVQVGFVFFSQVVIVNDVVSEILIKIIIIEIVRLLCGQGRAGKTKARRRTTRMRNMRST